MEAIRSFDQLNAFLAVHLMTNGNAFYTTLRGSVRPAYRSDAIPIELGERVAIEMERCSDAPEWIMVREGREVPERTVRNSFIGAPKPRDPS